MRSALLVLLGLFLPAVALADAVSPPPTTCIDGSMGVSCHGPPRCAPASCTADGDCGSGHVCRPVPLCIETISCGGITMTRDSNVTGTCLTGHCAAGGTCMTQSVCVVGTSPVDDPHPIDAPAPDGGAIVSRYGCCSITASPRGALGAALVLALWLTLTQKRRARALLRNR